MILNGNKLAQETISTIRQHIHSHLTQYPSLKRPGLAIIQVGNDVASSAYINRKVKLCQQNDIHLLLKQFNNNTPQKQIIDCIQSLNHDVDINGIIVQLPLPSYLSRIQISNAISTNKDVDCLNFSNFQNLVQKGEESDIIPCTPAAVLHIIDSHDIDVRNENVTVIGRSQLVGFPLSILLLKRNAKITICHSETTVKEHVEQADIVISCAGHPHLVKGEWVKKGAKLIDVGITRVQGTQKLVGDIEYEKALDKASFITPVPGGVGPLTVAMLFKNLYRVWCKKNGIQYRIIDKDEHFAQNYQF